MTIDPLTSPQRLIPSTVSRKATTERKAHMRTRTITDGIAEINTIAIFTGLGSTASDSGQPSIRVSV